VRSAFFEAVGGCVAGRPRRIFARMRIEVGALCVLLAVGGCRGSRLAPVADPASRRTTPSGEVVGFIGRYGSFVWLGLPYATPPVGDLRWRAPRPPTAWGGVREALEAGAPCVQYASPLGGIQTARANTPVGDEDCLTLNVYAPRGATPTSFLPVMVWIHGGGNTIGAGTLYDGGNLAASRDVVVVTVNYRLGPFGWFRHAALREGAASDADRSGNFATLDLVRALEWVQSHIAAFGGDPARVTIFGESAGATNVMTLLLTPEGVGLFHRAILQSGGLRMRDPARAEAFIEAPTDIPNTSNEAIAHMLVAAGRARDRADAKATLARMPPGELATWIRGLGARDVLTAYTPLPGIGMIVMPAVFPDGVVLPSEPYLERLRRADGWNRVPVMIGTNRDESKLFLFASPQWVHRWFGIVPRLIEPERYQVVGETMSAMWKATGVDEPATEMRASGATDVYAYRFDWDEEPTIVGADLSQMLGAFHGLEIPFVFDHFDLGREANRIFTRDNAPGRTQLAQAMMSYWTAFATNGRPGTGRDGQLPSWPAWDATTPSYLVLDTESGGGIRTSRDAVTRAGVLAAIEKDPRLAAPRDRCLLYHELVYGPGELPRADYDAKCPDHPFDAFPWRE
jgi:para-nitrobenzyl esterase